MATAGASLNLNPDSTHTFGFLDRRSSRTTRNIWSYSRCASVRSRPGESTGFRFRSRVRLWLPGEKLVRYVKKQGPEAMILCLCSRQKLSEAALQQTHAEPGVVTTDFIHAEFSFFCEQHRTGYIGTHDVLHILTFILAKQFWSCWGWWFPHLPATMSDFVQTAKDVKEIATKTGYERHCKIRDKLW